MQIKNITALSTEIITNEIPKYDPKLPIEWDQRFPVVLSDAETDGEAEKVNYFDFHSLQLVDGNNSLHIRDLISCFQILLLQYMTHCFP